MSSKSSMQSAQQQGDIIPDLLRHIETADMQVSCEEVGSSRRRREGGTKELIPLSNLSLLVFFLHGRHNDIDNFAGPVSHISAIPRGCTLLDLESIGIKDALMIGAAPPGIINLGSREDLPLYSKVIREHTELLVNTLLEEHLQKSLNDIEDSIAERITSSGIDSQISPPSSPRRERSRSPDRKRSEIPSKQSKLGDRDRGRDTRKDRDIGRSRDRERNREREREIDIDRERDRELSRGEHVGFAQRIKSACKFCLNFAYRIAFSPNSLLGYVKQTTLATPLDARRNVSSTAVRGAAPIFTACSENNPDKTCELSGDFFVEVACKLREKLKEMDDIRFPFLLTCLDSSCKNSSSIKSAIGTSKDRFGPVKVMKGFGTDIDPECFNKTLYYHPVNDFGFFAEYGATLYTIYKKKGKIEFIEKKIGFDSIFPTTARGVPIGWSRDTDGGQWTTFQGLLSKCRTLGLTEHVIVFDGSCSVFKTEQSCAATFGRGIVLGGGDRDGKIKRNRSKIYKKIRTKRTKRTNQSKQMTHLKKQNKTKRKYIRRHK